MIKTYPNEFLTRILPTCKKPVKQDIVDLMVSAASAIMVFLPAVLAGLLRGSRNSGRAVASIIAGAVVLIVMLCISPKIAFLPATVVSFIVYFGGALVSGRGTWSTRIGKDSCGD